MWKLGKTEHILTEVKDNIQEYQWQSQLAYSTGHSPASIVATICFGTPSVIYANHGNWLDWATIGTS